jgi:hypothetical protein
MGFETYLFDMVENAEDDITTVVLNNVKFDMFKWFHPTKVDYVRDRLLWKLLS